MRPYVLPLPRPERSLLVRDASFVVTERGVLKNKSVYIEGRRIREIGDIEAIRAKYGRWEEEIDATRKLVIPGLVNNHTHIAMTLLRGYAEDLPLLNWLREKVWPAEAKLKPEDIYLGAVAGAAEVLLSGTTSITTAYFYDERGSEAEALLDVGLRGIAAHGVFDWTRESAALKTEEMVKRFHGADDGRIRSATAPHTPYTCSPDLLREIAGLRVSMNEKYGEKYPVMNTLHVAEANNEAMDIQEKYKVPVKKGVASYLDSLGVLNEFTIAAHCIHLTEDDIRAFRGSGASVASCPVSNLKVGMGVADLPKLVSNGITVSLGTDGPASNNSLDMFETMKMASLLPKGLQGDTTLMNSKQVFDVATLGGARSMKQDSEIGSIAIGKRADIVVMNLTNAHSFPFYDAFSHLAYSAKSHDVRDVILDGRIIVRDRQLLSIEMEKLETEIESRVVSLGYKIP